MKIIKLLKPLTQNHVSFRLESDIRALYRPLGNKLNIREFFYAIINHKTNRMNVITTIAECNKAVLDDVSILNFNDIKPGMRYLASSSFSNERYRINRAFNVNNLLEFVEKRADETIMYGFGTHREDPDVLNDYLNSLHHFKSFVRHFETTAVGLLRIAKIDEIDISIPESHAHQKDNIILPKGKQAKLIVPEKEILKNLSYLLTAKEPVQESWVSPLEEKNAQNFELPAHFSKREIETLYYLLQGKSAKETAQILDISHRTVEIYIAAIKKKMGCQRKLEIHHKFHALGFKKFMK